MSSSDSSFYAVCKYSDDTSICVPSSQMGNIYNPPGSSPLVPYSSTNDCGNSLNNFICFRPSQDPTELTQSPTPSYTYYNPDA
jgi:hypothetical protein